MSLETQHIAWLLAFCAIPIAAIRFRYIIGSLLDGHKEDSARATTHSEREPR